MEVPLISSKLLKVDCVVLAERIASKAKTWASRALSYARRLQLINSFLFAMQVYYWSSIFILPKDVIIPCLSYEREMSLIVRG